MEPQYGDAPVERVPLHFYEEFVTYAAELEYLKAEVALLKSKNTTTAAEKTKRKRRRKTVK